jgi:hypothetical protein
MSTESDLQAAMASIQSDFAAYQTSVATEFTTLTAQIAALNAQSGPVTQAQLDALVSQAQAVDTAIKAAPVAPAA